MNPYTGSWKRPWLLSLTAVDLERRHSRWRTSIIISSGWKHIDFKIGGKLRNGSINANECKNVEFWKPRWRASNSMNITKAAKTRPNDRISTWFSGKLRSGSINATRCTNMEFLGTNIWRLSDSRKIMKATKMWLLFDCWLPKWHSDR